MYIIGINCLGPNTSACLLKDGNLIAMAEEERFNRIKTAPSHMPVNAIKYCLSQAGIELGDVQNIALGWNLRLFPDKYRKEVKQKYPPMKKRDDLMTDMISLLYTPDRVNDELRFALRAVGIKDKVPKIHYVGHHLSHAASVFFNSGFQDALVLAIDGSGELHTTTMWHGYHDDIKLLKQWLVPNSLGWFYAAITEYLGFSANSGEGKVMGLAPYGNEDFVIREKLKKFVKITQDGYEVDSTFIYFGKHEHRARFTDKLTKLLGTPYFPGNKTDYEQRHLNIAYETQRLLEEVVSHVVKIGFEKVATRNLCISGGVAMNCKLNGVLSQLECVKNIYVFPGANDGGTGLGAALWLQKKLKKKTIITNSFGHAYWGPEYSNDEILSSLSELKLEYEFYKNIEQATAAELAKGRFVGWFQGRMEYGSRALGNRSILADPSKDDVKDRINKFVKHREGFRPFAPSMLEENASEYIVSPIKSPYMMLAFKAKDILKEKAPAVVHVDNTVRVQFVNTETNLRYYKLILEFKKITGLPMLLNTSFNIRGEPIVCSPIDAIKCFFGTGLDVLVMGNYLLRKKTA